MRCNRRIVTNGAYRKAGDSLDGLRILVLELVVLQITNEKWADRIHFVQFNSEYGEKENIIKMERKI